VVKENKQLEIEESPRKSSKSLGGVERGHQTVQGFVRTFRASVMRRYKLKRFNTRNKLLPWVIKHAVFVANHFQKRKKTGFTVYRDRTGRDYEGKMYEFGETVLWRLPGPNKEKLSTRWSNGIWLGKDVKSDQDIVGTTHGIEMTRAVKKKPEDEQANQEILREMRGSPWDRKGVQGAGESGLEEPSVGVGAEPELTPATRRFGVTPGCSGCQDSHKYRPR